MNVFLCADLYDAAFLLCLGAQFKRVKEYYKNHTGKSFSIMELEGVTYEMLLKLQNSESEVNFHKFKEKRKKLKDKLEKYAKTVDYTEITSKEIHKIHRELEKQITYMKQSVRSFGPKRIIYDEKDSTTSDTSVQTTPMGN